MTKRELIEENEKLKNRIKELENNFNDISVNRVNIVLEDKQELLIYKDHNKKNSVVFQFTTTTAITPHACNSFSVVYN